MIILGVDPGSARAGFGLVVEEKRSLRHLVHGVVQGGSSNGLPHRLHRIYQAFGEIIEKHRPDTVAVEGIFHARNAKSSLILGHARGVILLACVEAGMEVNEYSPLQIKQAVTGYGQAGKEQIRYMIRSILELKEPPPMDASDALAVAICHAHFRGGHQRAVGFP
jgi:crossover junction endodeoxyribonuclease RuvC